MPMEVLEYLKEKSRTSKNLEELLEIPKERGEELNNAVITSFRDKLPFKDIFTNLFKMCKNDEEAIFALALIYYHNGLLTGTRISLQKSKWEEELKTRLKEGSFLKKEEKDESSKDN